MNLRDEARNRDCTIRLPGICCFQKDTSVLAHFSLIGISGRGFKSPDILAAFSCHTCHSYVDSHSDDATRLAFAHGVFRTQAILIEEGKIGPISKTKKAERTPASSPKIFPRNARFIGRNGTY